MIPRFRRDLNGRMLQDPNGEWVRWHEVEVMPTVPEGVEAVCPACGHYMRPQDRITVHWSCAFTMEGNFGTGIDHESIEAVEMKFIERIGEAMNDARTR